PRLGGASPRRTPVLHARRPHHHVVPLRPFARLSTSGRGRSRKGGVQRGAHALELRPHGGKALPNFTEITGARTLLERAAELAEGGGAESGARPSQVVSKTHARVRIVVGDG